VAPKSSKKENDEAQQQTVEETDDIETRRLSDRLSFLRAKKTLAEITGKAIGDRRLV
jgi:hypothetical protein